MKRRSKIGGVLLILVAVVYSFNASWIAGAPDGEMSLLAHRGVHQTYHREGLDNETCTAQRIDAPAHAYMENTLPSMQAALDAGANIIEIDIHRTHDGEFAVFHDWTVDCRTDGAGDIRDHTLAELKALDIGYGYTADGGVSYPFRGQFINAVPTLSEVLAAFPDAQFDVNIKGGSVAVARTYLDYVDAADWPRLSLTANPAAGDIVQVAFPNMYVQSRKKAKACMKGYVLSGWYGGMPEACHNSYVPVPANFRPLVWGWPHRFEKRLHRVGSRSMLMGDYGGHGSVGLDEIDQLHVVPRDYKGIVFTNKIEVVGPVLRQMQVNQSSQ